eukprot:TRINITY_DN15243_c0_g1_i1.p1 TRINITY_DN15243_c0_g1~~TRINITY_DN15243_c0_g1_i1.p1  ORF type:complete len:389 (+),score=76.06 TRINITY_DN15243_c0_g1_i1:42-1208(+)
MAPIEACPRLHADGTLLHDVASFAVDPISQSLAIAMFPSSTAAKDARRRRQNASGSSSSSGRWKFPGGPEESGGPSASAASAGEFSTGSSTARPSSIASSGCTARSNRSSEVKWGSLEVIPWERIFLGHRIKPYRGYAHCPDDIYLVSRLLELVEVPDVRGDTVKLLLRSLKFLRLCDYSADDICSVLAHASAYFLDAYVLCGNQMDAAEVGHVLVTLMFIAHCYVQDETCPLQVWQQQLFRKYCSLKTLDAAIMRLLEIRGFVLRLEDEDLRIRFRKLSEVIQENGRGTQAPSDAGSSAAPATPASAEAAPATCAAGGADSHKATASSSPHDERLSREPQDSAAVAGVRSPAPEPGSGSGYQGSRPSPARSPGNSSGFLTTIMDQFG